MIQTLGCMIAFEAQKWSSLTHNTWESKPEIKFKDMRTDYIKMMCRQK